MRLFTRRSNLYVTAGLYIERAGVEETAILLRSEPADGDPVVTLFVPRADAPDYPIGAQVTLTVDVQS